jgi:hypothetical protein
MVVSIKAIRFSNRWLLNSEGIRGLAFYPFIFVPTDTVIDDVLINHEKIHLKQQL